MGCKQLIRHSAMIMKFFLSYKNIFFIFAVANRKEWFVEKEAFYAPYSSDVKLDTLHKENKE